MPICEKCNHRWSWKQTIKKISKLYSEMTCPYCGEKQYQTKRSKTKAPFLSLIVLLPLLIQAFFDVPVAILLSLIPALAVITFLLYPFLVEVSNKEEFLF